MVTGEYPAPKGNNMTWVKSIFSSKFFSQAGIFRGMRDSGSKADP
jgi:hypothetical protein